MQRNKVFLLFPDGVGIRNYLYSNYFKNPGDDLVLFHNFSAEVIDYLKGFTNIQSAVLIPEYRETATEKFLRELICYLRLHYNAKLKQNPTILSNWKSKHPSLFNTIFYKAIEMSAVFFKGYANILKLERAYNKAIRRNPFYTSVKAIFETQKPDAIFCSHQRGLKAATIFAAANDVGIATTTCIYSWDNLPKARLALRAARYLVWSDYMKSEMADYYPEIATDSVIVSGTPQFSFYNDPDNIIGRDVFFNRFGLNPNKKTICFSGDDEMTSPDDPKYLEDLSAAIRDNGLESEVQILMRRCPVDFSKRYDRVLQYYKDLIREAPPAWKVSGKAHFGEKYPLYEDVALLVSTAFYCDVVVNVGSTMAFDFAMFDKPCLFINYDQEVKENPQWSVSKIYRFQHFRTMDGLNPVGWLNSKNEIADQIRQAIYLPKQVGPDRKAWMHKVVKPSKS